MPETKSIIRKSGKERLSAEIPKIDRDDFKEGDKVKIQTIRKCEET
jgi:hypothetical protein